MSVEIKKWWNAQTMEFELTARGRSIYDIAKALHMGLMREDDPKTQMEIARQLMDLGWRPPPDHPILMARVRDTGDAENPPSNLRNT